MKYLCFDLDGTLVDSAEGIETTFLHTFKQLGVPAPDKETLRTFIGPPLEVTVKSCRALSYLLQRNWPTTNLSLPIYQRTPSSIEGIGLSLIHYHL